MVKKIYLNGGADTMKGESRGIDQKILGEVTKKNVCVINLTTDDQVSNTKYRIFLGKYFKDLGAEKVFFYSTSKNIETDILESGIIYLPGGNTELLLNNLNKFNLVNLIKNFKGIIIGNSAGSMVLCNKAICAYENKGITKGLGLINISIDVHYDKSHDERLKNLFYNEEIYGVPEKSVIVVENKKLNFIGDVYKFSNGEKTKVN